MSFLTRLMGARSIASGAVLYVAMRWFDRAVGVLSTIVLARVLAPDDFGIVALATVVVGIASMMLDVGVPIRLVQMERIDEEDVNTAWTIQLIEFLLIAGVLLGLASTVAGFYGDSRLEAVLQVQALSTGLAGLGNMSAVLFQRQRQYAREVSYYMMRRLVTFLVTLALALYLRDYWALIIGSLVGTVFGVALSYWMDPVIRKPTLSRWRGFAGASVWLTAWSMGRYASEQIDKLFVGKVGGSSALGAYTLADQVAAMPSSELLLPLNRAIFPALSQKQGAPDEFRRIFLSGLGIQAAIAVPASIGLALVSPELVAVLLGEKWIAAVPLLTVLALAYGMSGVTTAFNYLLIATGRFGGQAALYWANTVMLAALLSVLFWVNRLDVDSVAAARLVTALAFSAGVVVLALRGAHSVRFVDCLKVVWRVMLASAVMSVCVGALGWCGVVSNALFLLAAKVVVGVVSYGGVLFLLWCASGYPEGAEQWAVAQFKRFVRRD